MLSDYANEVRANQHSEIRDLHVTLWPDIQTGQCKTRTADCRLRTTDCGLGIKHGLGVKYGLRTEYKTWTRYKMRTTDYVYKNSFRKVKLREMGSGVAKTVVPALTFPWLFKQFILPTEKEGYAGTQGN